MKEIIMSSKKGESENVIMNTVGYLLFLAVVIAAVITLIWLLMNGAVFWGDYGAHTLAKLINNAQPGDEIKFDVTQFTKIAQKNGVSSMSDVFSFDNVQKQVCLKLSRSKKACYSYYKNYDIIGNRLEMGVSHRNMNLLYFKVAEGSTKSLEGSL